MDSQLQLDRTKTYNWNKTCDTKSMTRKHTYCACSYSIDYITVTTSSDSIYLAEEMHIYSSSSSHVEPALCCVNNVF